MRSSAFSASGYPQVQKQSEFEPHTRKFIGTNRRRARNGQLSSHRAVRPAMPRGSPKGPAPLLLTGKEVDALYDCMELLHGALQRLAIPYTLIAGSLLGAVRSQSILFCDDDVSGREAAGCSRGCLQSKA